VRSQHYTTLQEAIAGARAEEKVKGPTSFRYKAEQPLPQGNRSKTMPEM